MKNEEKIKQLNKIIKDWNNIKNVWIFSAIEIANLLDHLYGYKNQSEFVNNCMKYLVRNKQVIKELEKSSKN